MWSIAAVLDSPISYHLAAGLVAALLAASLAAAQPAESQAARRGMRFIGKLARDPKMFWDYGHDLLWCFYSVAATCSDPVLSEMARTAGVERAREFHRLLPELPRGAGADWVSALAFGSYAADLLGVRDPRMKQQIRRAAPRFTARDFLNFDPLHEPPPADVPEDCARCGRSNPRGCTVCGKCGAPLSMQSRYYVWYNALVTAYSGERYGVMLGARYREVLRWASVMRPYQPRHGNPELWPMIYAATHVVYTLNDYSKYRLSPRCLPDEVDLLKWAVPQAIAARDAETLGEILDSLRAFGFSRSDPLIRSGIEYLLRSQNADGSWGDVEDKDPYNRYHATWCAMAALYEYRWKRVLCPAND